MTIQKKNINQLSFKAISLIAILLTIFVSNGWSQSYHIEVNLTGVFSTGCTPLATQIETTFGGRSLGTSLVSSYPQNIFNETFDTTPPDNILTLLMNLACTDGGPGGIYLCSTGGLVFHNEPININGSGACLTNSIHLTDQCQDGVGPISSIDIYFEVRWEPVYDIITQSGTNICEDSDLTLSTTSGYTEYLWEYKDSSSPSFQPFFSNPGTSSSVSFGIEDIYGPSYQSKLGLANSIQFQVVLGACTPITTQTPVHFFPISPKVLTDDPIDLQCHGDLTGGTYKVLTFNRPTIPGEVFKITATDVNDPLNNVHTLDNITSVPTQLITGIPPGDYTVLVEGFVGAQATSCGTPELTTFKIIDPTQVSITNAITNPPSCHSSTTGTKDNGSITITGGGGTGVFTYSIDAGTLQASNSFSGQMAGNHSVKVKDGHGCEAVSSINIAEPPNITVNTPVITSDHNGRHISCVGSSDGQISISATSPRTLSYSIDNGANFYPGNVFNGLTAGDYSIIVKDNAEVNGCLKSSSLVSVLPPPAITGSASATPTSCFELSDGKIQVDNPAGGTGTLSFSLSDDGVIQSSTLFTGRAANTYTVTIHDANGCTKTTNTATIVKPAAIGVTATPTLVTCSGGNDGTLTLLASNTQGSVSYSIDAGALQPSSVFNNLSPTNHTFLVQDGNGCTSTGNVTVNSNPIITGPITTTPISCNGGANGALNLTPGGGVGPYTFAWSNGPTTEDISGLPIGTYSVIITDTKNCQKTFNRTLTQPQPVTVSAVTSDFNGSGVSCFNANNGSVDITSAGGNGGYTYAWSNSSTSEDLTGLSSGTYSVTVTDSKGCLGNKSTVITQPAQLILSIDNTQNISCFGGNNGSVTLSAGGGTLNYEYSINNGNNWQSIPTFTNLVAANFTVVTRDVNGCTDNDALTLTSPSEVILTVDNITNTSCAQLNGSATASALGGVSSYSFKWFNSSNAQIGSSNVITNLSAGVYHVEVVDQNSCSKQQNVTISSSDGPAITVDAVTSASCSNSTDGSATISISQGQTPYTIMWPNGQTTTTATNLAGGDYMVEVRDNTNCLSLQTVTVPKPTALTIQTIDQQDPSCNGSTNGAIEIAAQGGNGTYTYTWNTGATSTTLTNLIAGTYTVTIADIKNCKSTLQVTIIDPPLFTIDLGANQKICEGQTIVKRSDVDNANYAWTGPNNFASNLQQVSLTQPGVYTITVTNQNGCEATDSFELSFDTNLLKADFLMVSQAFVGDTIIAIDISWPLPSSISWQFDPAAVVLDESQDFSVIRFDDPGEYNVSILAQLAQCTSSYSQNISIVENPNPKEGGRVGSENIIRVLHVFPNPTTDRLTVEIELREENQATIEMYHVQSNRREFSQIFKDDLFYSQDFKIGHFQSGLYVVVVKVGNEMKSVRVIKL